MLLLPKVPLAQTGRKGAGCCSMTAWHLVVVMGGVGFWLVGPEVEIECGPGLGSEASSLNSQSMQAIGAIHPVHSVERPRRFGLLTIRLKGMAPYSN